MLEKGMPKVCKMMPKGSQNESQNPSKIAKILKKRHAEIDARIWCRKKVQKYPEMSYKGTKGRAPGGKEGKPPKAALRYLASWVWNAWHRPVSADCSSGRPPTPWDPGCWSDYFIHETGGHWQKQASVALNKFKKNMQKLMPKKLWTLMLKGFQNEAKMDAEINGCRKKRPQNMPKSLKYHQNGDQNRSQIN